MKELGEGSIEAITNCAIFLRTPKFCCLLTFLFNVLYQGAASWVIFLIQSVVTSLTSIKDYQHYNSLSPLLTLPTSSFNYSGKDKATSSVDSSSGGAASVRGLRTRQSPAPCQEGSGVGLSKPLCHRSCPSSPLLSVLY